MEEYFLIKYALTGGIEKVNGELLDSGKYVKVKNHYNLYIPNRDIFNNENDAIKAANEIVSKKIASLNKQLLKLNKTKF